jgi:hypothetical protein
MVISPKTQNISLTKMLLLPFLLDIRIVLHFFAAKNKVNAFNLLQNLA